MPGLRRPASPPRFIKPQLSELVRQIPTGDARSDADEEARSRGAGESVRVKMNVCSSADTDLYFAELWREERAIDVAERGAAAEQHGFV